MAAGGPSCVPLARRSGQQSERGESLPGSGPSSPRSGDIGEGSHTQPGAGLWHEAQPLCAAGSAGLVAR
jgi:hypothetical protein